MITIQSDTITAALQYPGSIALVFASHKRAGGGYLNHEKGQEEWIARRSNLVECLQPHLHLYGDNRKPFYIMLKDVKITGLPTSFTTPVCESRDLIVAHAPVAPLWLDPVSEIETRIKVICEMVKDYKTFLTGPFGCGFFGNDVVHVKSCFEKYATNEEVIWIEKV